MPPLGVPCKRLSGEERVQLLQDLLSNMIRQLQNQPRLPGAPIEALDLIRQYDARHLQGGREWHFEWIALYLRGDRTDEGQADL